MHPLVDSGRPAETGRMVGEVRQGGGGRTGEARVECVGNGDGGWQIELESKFTGSGLSRPFCAAVAYPWVGNRLFSFLRAQS